MAQRVTYAQISPSGMKALGGVHIYVSQSGLPSSLVDLVYLRVSLINGCAYCIDMHSRDLLEAGIPIEKLVLVPVWRDSGDLFSPRERAALSWAETVTCVAETGVPDAAFEDASQHFTEKESSTLRSRSG